MSRPVIVYDDECGFCKWCVRQALEHGEFDVLGFDELPDAERHRLPDDYEDCVHLVTDDAVYSCGEAVEQALLRMRTPAAAAVALASHIPRYGAVRDAAYRAVADNRDVFGRIRSCDDIDDQF